MSDKRKERCETCRFWRVYPGDQETDTRTGQCRRRSPCRAEQDGVFFWGEWPVTFWDSWCGEYSWCGEWQAKGT